MRRTSPPAKPAAAVALPDDVPRLITVQQAALALNLSHWAIRDAITRGYLPCVRLPGAPNGSGAKDLRRILIAVSDLQKFIADHRVERPAAAPSRPRARRAG